MKPGPRRSNVQVLADRKLFPHSLMSGPGIAIEGSPLKWRRARIAHRAASKNVRIIVIDDESLIAETVVEILGEQGFEAIPVSSGASAIELAKTVRPAIVLSDVIMPGLNGIETGIKIREIVPNCKVILFSGQAATVDLLEKARSTGIASDISGKTD